MSCFWFVKFWSEYTDEFKIIRECSTNSGQLTVQLNFKNHEINVHLPALWKCSVDGMWGKLSLYFSDQKKQTNINHFFYPTVQIQCRWYVRKVTVSHVLWCEWDGVPAIDRARRFFMDKLQNWMHIWYPKNFYFICRCLGSLFSYNSSHHLHLKTRMCVITVYI